jgi:hypothetical protein
VTSDPASGVDAAQRLFPIVDAPTAVTTIEAKYAERIMPFMEDPCCLRLPEKFIIGSCGSLCCPK